jgi:hypothetical protein
MRLIKPVIDYDQGNQRGYYAQEARDKGINKLVVSE